MQSGVKLRALSVLSRDVAARGLSPETAEERQTRMRQIKKQLTFNIEYINNI